jgi:HSP20 family protein
MSELILWKEREINRLRKDMDRLFKSCGYDAGLSVFLEKTYENIPIETVVTRDSFIVKAVIKDMDPENLDLVITNEKLAIKGRRKKPTVNNRACSWFEDRCVNTFIRTIPLPFRIETSEVKAVFRGNLLKIVMPRWKPEKIYVISIET